MEATNVSHHLRAGIFRTIGGLIPGSVRVRRGWWKSTFPTFCSTQESELSILSQGRASKRKGCSRQDGLEGLHLQVGGAGCCQGYSSVLHPPLHPVPLGIICNSAGLQNAPSYFCLSHFCEEWGEVYYILPRERFFKT